MGKGSGMGRVKKFEWAWTNIENGNREMLLNVVKECASVLCTVQETASILGANMGSFLNLLQHDEEAKNVWELGMSGAKRSLRRKQFELADKNPVMAIFLGKNLLGQIDERTLQKRGQLEIKVTQKQMLEGLGVDDLNTLKTLLGKAKDRLEKDAPKQIESGTG